MMQDILEFFGSQIELTMLPFSIPMGLCLLYWILMIVGFLDLELLDSLFGLSDGLAEGAAEGAAEGLAEGAVDGAVDGAVEGATDAAADSIEGAAESFGFLAAFMGFLNFGHAPATIVLTIFTFFMWFFANIGRFIFAHDTAASAGALLGMFAGTFVVCLIISSIVTHFAGKPFKKLLAICTYRGGIFLIGKVCEVRSSKVSAHGGQAELTLEGGSPLRLHVICDHENELKKGNKAVIIDYEKDKDQYVVEPMF